MSDRYVIIFGGAKHNITLIRTAHRLGLKTIVIDINIAAPGMQLADIPLVLSRDDLFNISSSCCEISRNHEIIAVYCGIDIGLTPFVLAQLLDIPYPSPRSALLSLDKGLAAKLMRKAGVSVAEGKIFRYSDNFAWDIFPCIVKPLSSSGSSGVSRVEKYSDLSSAIAHAKQYSRDGRILVEEFLVGSLHEMNAFMHNNVFYPCMLSDCSVLHEDAYNTQGYFITPTALSAEVAASSFDMLEKSVRAAAITDGPVKGDLLVSPEGKPYLIEFSPRFHGVVCAAVDGTSTPIYDSFYQYLKARMGEKPESLLYNTKVHCGGVKLFSEPGEICSLPTEAEAKSIPGVDFVYHIKKLGDYLSPEAFIRAPVYVAAHADNRGDLLNTFTRIRRELKVSVK